MRYSQTSLDFWLVVKKLFKGKGIRFFSGEKQHSVETNRDDDDIHDIGNSVEDKSIINFAVPSSKVLLRESNKYKFIAEQPGILKGSLETFREYKGDYKECKISFDEKKCAPGFGKKLGDEDIGGFEHPPTLRERQDRLEKVLAQTEDILKDLDT